MHLVDVQRALHEVALAARLEPGGVLPLVAIQGPQARGGAGGLFGVERVGVGLVETLPVIGLDEVLVELAAFGTLFEAFPEARRLYGGERAGGLVPVVELADHVHGAHVRDPHAEAPALDAVLDVGVSAHLLPAALPGSLLEKMDIAVRYGELRPGRLLGGQRNPLPSNARARMERPLDCRCGHGSLGIDMGAGMCAMVAACGRVPERKP